MQFIILSRREIKNYKCDKPHIIISIKDPETSDIEIIKRDNCIGILRLSFHDLNRTCKDYKIFSKRDAKEILNFAAYPPIKVDIIICQCEAGISRSAGVAGALSKIINGDDKAIFRQYLPNMLVYRTIMKEAYRDTELCNLLNEFNDLIETYRNPLKTIIEKALAKKDGFKDPKKHKNLHGSKKHYIKAILEALKNE